MTASADLLKQRSFGELKFHMGEGGPALIREAGSSKLRIPRGSHEAIIINTGGGLAGGDQFEYEFSCRADAKLTLTSQAAERVYRTLGPAAKIQTWLNAAHGATLAWLPQETILYDGAALRRQFNVALQGAARFLAVEPLVLGRTEMGEHVTQINLKDRWRIQRDGVLVHAEDLMIGRHVPVSRSTLNGAKAFATVIYMAGDAESKLDGLRAIMMEHDAASAWNGKLIARFVAVDGFCLRKALIPVLYNLAGGEGLPKIWTA